MSRRAGRGRRSVSSFHVYQVAVMNDKLVFCRVIIYQLKSFVVSPSSLHRFHRSSVTLSEGSLVYFQLMVSVVIRS